MKKHVFTLTLMFLVSTLIFTVVASGAKQQQKKGVFRNIMTVFRLPSPAEQKSVAQQLDLTNEQKTEMKALTEKYRREGSKLLENYNIAYKKVIHLMETTSPDPSEINKTLKHFHKVHSQLVDKTVEYWRDFKNILTLEQNKKFWSIFEKSRVRSKS